MADLVQQPVIQALAWALVHFIWQGAAIGLATYLAFRIARTASARYAIGVGALATMAVAPVLTFAIIASQGGSPTSIVGGLDAVGPTPASIVGSATAATDLAAPAVGIRVSPELLAIAVLGWIAGVAFFSIRLLGGWVVARRMAMRAVQPAADHIQAIASDLSDRLGLDRAVVVLQSSAVAVPVLVGWLKPTVVLPIAALSGLSPSQVESLIAHELAHVRRHDYLVNLLQSAVEVALFYHPATWWVSRRVRAERELCCDDVAVGLCDRLVYATALSDLAAMSSAGVALAATDGNLLNRVRRILGQPDANDAGRAQWMPAMLLGLAAALILPVAILSAGDRAADQERHVIVDTHKTAINHVDEQSGQQSGRMTVEEQRKLEETLRKMIEELQKQLQKLTPMSGTHVEEKGEKPKEQQRVLEEFARHQELFKSEEMRKEFDKALQDKGFQAAADAHRKMLDQSGKSHDQAMAEAQAHLEQARKLFDRGLMSKNQLDEVHTAMEHLKGERQAFEQANQKAMIQNRLDVTALAQFQGTANANAKAQAQAQAELQQALMQLARANELLNKGLLSERDAQKMQAAARELQQKVQERHGQVADEVMKQVLEQRKVVLDHEALMKPIQSKDQKLTSVGEKDPVRSGDVLRITIAGEPDLPTNYNVGQAGTVRIPFVGVIKVNGLTASEVREAVGKQLSEKRLGSASQVRVTVLRGGK